MKYLTKKAIADMETLVPEDLREEIIDYVERGIQPGSFLTAVIENDLSAALSLADYTNRGRLNKIVSWFHMHMPSMAWRDKLATRRWRAYLMDQPAPSSDFVERVIAS